MKPSEPSGENAPGPASLPPLRLGRALRFGSRAAWDALGFVCAMSLTFFVVGLLPVGTALRLSSLPGAAWRLGAVVLAAVVGLLLIPPVYAGICRLTHVIYERDEPVYADLWRGVSRLYGQAVLLGAAQAGMALLLAANALFYVTRASLPMRLPGLLFLYLLLFWAMNCLYHWPLLIAADAGLFRREDGASRPRLFAVLRNGFLLALSAPGFTFLLLLVIMAANLLLTLTGVGLALLAPGWTAFLTTQATRDQLARFGILPEPEDPDAPVVDEGWRTGA